MIDHTGRELARQPVLLDVRFNCAGYARRMSEMVKVFGCWPAQVMRLG
jgi:hypothetical protein